MTIVTSYPLKCMPYEGRTGFTQQLLIVLVADRLWRKTPPIVRAEETEWPFPRPIISRRNLRWLTVLKWLCKWDWCLARAS
jgi:hypothetical protein